MNKTKNLNSIIQQLPELATVQDLVKIGFYRTPQAAYQARLRRICPPWLRIPGRGIVYPKGAVIEWLQQLGTPNAK